MTAAAPDQLMELVAINRAIAAATDYDALLQLVVHRTASLLRAGIVVLVLAEHDGEASIAASIGLEPAKARAFRAPLDEGLGASVCRLVACAPERFLGVPVIESGRVRGILAVYRHRQPFNEAATGMLSALADQAAIAMGNVRTMHRLEEAVSALRESDRRKDDFLGMLSHELRNPLAPIRT